MAKKWDWRQQKNIKKKEKKGPTHKEPPSP